MGYKDSKEWKRVGFPLSTTSNEAAMMYDAALTQYMTGYSDDSIGGLGPCLEKMFAADPEFVLGHAFKNMIAILDGSTSVRGNNEMKTRIARMVDMAEHQELTPLERLHVDAVKLWSDGNSTSACEKWEEILLYFPTDVMALQGAAMTYFNFGRMQEYTDCVARVLPYWESSTSPRMYSVLKGYYAIGLLEINLLDEAKTITEEALELNPKDCRGVHAMSHVLEARGCYNDAVSFLLKKEGDIQNNYLTSHIYWHLGASLIEKGEFEKAMTLYDEKVAERAGEGKRTYRTDASSFLYRLELEGVDVGNRWQKLYEHWVPHLYDHAFMFNDIHLLMAALGAKQKDVVTLFMDSIKAFVREADDTDANAQVYKRVGVALCEAFQAFDNGDYGKAVDIMSPIRYKIVDIGGSASQRDVFSLVIIHAALKSSDQRNRLFARSLLQERKAQGKNSPLTDRLFALLTASS